MGDYSDDDILAEAKKRIEREDYEKKVISKMKEINAKNLEFNYGIPISIKSLLTMNATLSESNSKNLHIQNITKNYIDKILDSAKNGTDYTSIQIHCGCCVNEVMNGLQKKFPECAIVLCRGGFGGGHWIPHIHGKLNPDNYYNIFIQWNDFGNCKYNTDETNNYIIKLSKRPFITPV